MSFDDIVALKKLGNVALISGIHTDALKHFTAALDMLKINEANADNYSYKSCLLVDHLQASLYGKRSVAFLRLGQFYYAHEDAKQTVNIAPDWFKGYVRQADIELNCGLFPNALKNYQLALRYLDIPAESETTDQVKELNYEKLIHQKIQHVLFMMQRERCVDYQLPWIGAALGLVVGMAIITWDYVSHGANVYIHNPILKLAFIGLVAYVFFWLASFQRSHSRKCKLELLKPPVHS